MLRVRYAAGTAVPTGVRARPFAICARIKHVAGRVCVILDEVFGRGVQFGPGFRGEAPGRGLGRVEGDRPVLSEPAMPAAVQHLCVRMPVVFEHPPEPRSDERVVVVVGHHGGVRGNAELAHHLFEGGRGRDERPVVAARRIVFLDIEVDWELDGARDVRPPVGLHRRAIDDPDVRVVRVGGDPIGFDEQFGVSVFHSSAFRVLSSD